MEERDSSEELDLRGKSSTGLEENVVAVASYFGLVSLLILYIEKRSVFVRFHAIQSAICFSAIFVLWVCTRTIGLLEFLKWAPGICSLLLAIPLMIKAYYGEILLLPIVGNIAYKRSYETPEGRRLLEEFYSRKDSEDDNEEERK